MGNYGNKFDSDVGASSSTTEPGNAVFDGVQYHYMAWTSKKPILMVTSQWEDISFRLYAMNLILRTCDRMETQINRLKLLIKQDADEIEIASEIVSILDMLIMETSKKLPDPRGRTASNQLDRRIHRQRVQTFITICQEAKHLRQNCTDAQEAIAAINDFLERLNLVSYELTIRYFFQPQNSFPDVVIWMISDNERVAYARIPAYEILYASEKPEFCGRYCSKPHTITLKYPTANVKSKKHYKVPGQLRIIAWLGRAADQENFEFHSRGQISVYADTFETETKIPVRGWGPDGYTDITGDIPLENCPPGWEWDGDWKINSELALLYDTSQGHMHVLEDAFEFQYRFPAGAWEPEKMTNGKNEDIPQLSSITVPEGWEWESEWTVDTNRACDEDALQGWEYSAPDDDTAGEIAWGTIEKTYHTSRRRRLVRNRVCIDQKVFKKAEKTEELLGEGWEYATTMSSQFHIMPKMLDLVRRRRWVRKKKSKKKIPKMPSPKIYIVYEDLSKLHLRAYIYQGRDLLPMDQDSFSDPVAMVSFLNQTRRTEVYKHSLNPIWDQTLMVDIMFYGDLEHLQRNCPDVAVEVFDRDDVGSLEFMGRTSGKPLLKFDPEEDQIPKLQWYSVKKANQAGGSVLAAFELILKHDQRKMPLPPPCKTDVQVPMVPFGIRPVLQRTALEFLIWGVRKMESFNLLSVDSPSVLIQIGEVEIRTKIIKSLKKNPNFSDPIYYIEANLPVDDLYFPPIVIRVKDNRKFGRRPTVGQHIITNSLNYRIKPGAETSDTEGRSIQLDIIQEEEERQPLLLFHEHTKKIREDEIDWWSKYYASIGETGMYGNYEESGLDLIKVYKNELEKQENFNHFSDFIQTFRLFRGKVEDEDEEPEFAGEFKCLLSLAFYEYFLPFGSLTETFFFLYDKEVKVRIYVVRASELAPQDSNGLADPYLKIKVGKKRILDRENYIPNTLDPTFGRMFELDLKLPMEKDLYVEVFDWDLIGTDDKIGETIIDLENRYLSKFKAWCALPETYCISGPCPWRDQMKPKEWLEQKCREQKWDEPVWNSNTCVMVAGKTYKLDDYEKDMVNWSTATLNNIILKPCEHLGPADERLALHILRTFPHVPEHVETRPLFYDVLPNIEQGRLQMWVDMFPKEFGDPGLPYNIEPRKPSKYFLRMVVWNCSEIPMMDVSMLGDQMSDIYFKGWLSGLEHKRQKTDVHYRPRSLDGTGNFNWRFVFPFDYLPQERMVHVAKKEHLWSLDKTVTKFPPVLNIQVWDNDLIGANEYISKYSIKKRCEIVLPITNMPKCCKFQRFCTLENVPDMQGNCKNEMLNLFDQKMALKGWWPLYRVVDGVRDNKKYVMGKLEMSVEILSAEEEEAKPAGQGRDEPNMNPKLEKPNRPATSFAWFSSPFKSLRYIIWRKYKWVILGVLGVLLLVAFIVLFFYSFPQIFSEEVGKLF
uniref:C2 domain-containing protein n=1 Tax=Ciona intestinalis TaxID=7719 RepID=F6X313_CIOIN